MLSVSVLPNITVTNCWEPKCNYTEQLGKKKKNTVKNIQEGTKEASAYDQPVYFLQISGFVGFNRIQFTVTALKLDKTVRDSSVKVSVQWNQKIEQDIQMYVKWD